MKANPLPLDAIRRLLSYDPESGILLWKVSPRANVPAGSVAGCATSRKGYRVIGIGLTYYAAHRVAWALHYGEDPGAMLDHANGRRDDNRIANLRKTTNSLNKHNSGAQSNNACGHKGVMWCASKRKWRARIMVDGQRVHLGRFNTKEEASSAYEAAAQLLVGEFAHASAATS